jgi:hypothetical protein
VVSYWPKVAPCSKHTLILSFLEVIYPPVHTDRMKTFGWGLFLVSFSLGLTACDTDYKERLKRAGQALLGKPSSKNKPLAKNLNNEAEPKKKQRAKANAELFGELWEIVLLRKPKNKIEFGNWVDTLNQGASLEGVYNAFTHSSLYRALEKAYPKSSSQALKVFAEDLAILTSELKERTAFDEDSAKPLSDPVPVGLDSSIVNYSSTQKVAENSKSRKELVVFFLNLFKDASPYTLKRLLGDEALRVISEKEKEKNLPEWYSSWVILMNRHSIEYGLELRNKPDKNFHKEWAKRIDGEILKWEVLNRLHRTINKFMVPKKTKK